MAELDGSMYSVAEPMPDHNALAMSLQILADSELLNLKPDAARARIVRGVCTDGDFDEDIRCGILRAEHRNVFPSGALSTTSDRTAQISR